MFLAYTRYEATKLWKAPKTLLLGLLLFTSVIGLFIYDAVRDSAYDVPSQRMEALAQESSEMEGVLHHARQRVTEAQELLHAEESLLRSKDQAASADKVKAMQERLSFDSSFLKEAKLLDNDIKQEAYAWQACKTYPEAYPEHRQEALSYERKKLERIKRLHQSGLLQKTSLRYRYRDMEAFDRRLSTVKILDDDGIMPIDSPYSLRLWSFQRRLQSGYPILLFFFIVIFADLFVQDASSGAYKFTLLLALDRRLIYLSKSLLAFLASITSLLLLHGLSAIFSLIRAGGGDAQQPLLVSQSLGVLLRWELRTAVFRSFYAYLFILLFFIALLLFLSSQLQDFVSVLAAILLCYTSILGMLYLREPGAFLQVFSGLKPLASLKHGHVLLLVPSSLLLILTLVLGSHAFAKKDISC